MARKKMIKGVLKAPVQAKEINPVIISYKEARYTAAGFVRENKSVKEYAMKYVTENIKPNYGHEDFDALRKMIPMNFKDKYSNNGIVVKPKKTDNQSSMHWKEEDLTFDRAIKWYEGE